MICCIKQWTLVYLFIHAHLMAPQWCHQVLGEILFFFFLIIPCFWNKVVLEPRVSPEHNIKVCGYSDPFCKTWTKGHWPLDDLWPHICWGHMCDSTQGSLCRSPMKIHQSMWIQWPFLQKTWTEGHWPLDDLWPHICWGLMCDSTQGSLCSSPMKIHQSMWIQWTFSPKLEQKGHWPLDDLWPHIRWGHMCDSTKGSLCPSPMGIHQCMWIQ